MVIACLIAIHCAPIEKQYEKHLFSAIQVLVFSLEYRSVDILMVYQCGNAGSHVLNLLHSEYSSEG